MPLSADDRAAIVDLAGRYAHTIDLGDPAGWADCFTEDGSFEFTGQTARGREELRKFADSVKSMPAPFRHMATTFAIDGDGESATMVSYVTVWRLESPPRVIALGRYEDQLQRVDGCWKFKRRRAILDWSDA